MHANGIVTAHAIATRERTFLPENYKSISPCEDREYLAVSLLSAF